MTVDKTAPEKLALTCPEAETVNYAPYGWLFSKTGITVTMKAEDEDIRASYGAFSDESGGWNSKKEGFIFLMKKRREREAFRQSSWRRSLISEAFLQAEQHDWAGNCSVLTRSCAVESEEKHGETGKAEITAGTEPGRVVDGTAYYRGDVRFRISLADAWSGIKKCAV